MKLTFRIPGPLLSFTGGRHVVGSDSIRDTGGLATPVGDRAEIAIIPGVSGGCAQEFAPRM